SCCAAWCGSDRRRRPSRKPRRPKSGAGAPRGRSPRSPTSTSGAPHGRRAPRWGRNGSSTMDPLDLVPLWAAILALAVFMYVLLDGFDLGVAMLFPFRRDAEERDRMIASVAPVWDFNVT